MKKNESFFDGDIKEEKIEETIKEQPVLVSGHDCLKEANSAGYCMLCGKYVMPQLNKNR